MKRDVRKARNLLYEAREAPEAKLRQAVKIAIVLLGPTHKRSVKDPAKAARRTTVKELDALCRKIVFARARGACEWCAHEAAIDVRLGDTQGVPRNATDWCHVYSRRYKWLRWEPLNSWAGCKGCHLKWHHRPTEAAKWWQEQIGGAKYDTLRMLAARPQKTDQGLVKAHLLQEAKRLGIEV